MHSVRLASGFAVLALIASGACSTSDTTTPAAASPTLRFVAASATPDFLEVPYPTDAYLAGGKVIEIPGVSSVVKQNAKYLTHELAKQDGFSRIAMALFYVDDPSKPLDDDNQPVTAEIDPATLPITEADCTGDGSSVYLIDLEATDAAKARVACRAAFHHPQGTRTRPTVGVGPARGVVLEEGHRYAAVLTSRVTDDKGKHVVASADFKALLSGAASPLSAVYAPAIAKVTSALATALASDKATIVGIAPFTTNKMAHELFDARDWLEDQPTPTLKWDAAGVAPMAAVKFAQATAGVVPAGFIDLDAWLGKATVKLASGADDTDSRLGVHGHDKIAALGTAEFDAANFLQNKGNYDTFDHATFAHDAQGKVIVAPEKPTSKIWLTVAIPTAPMPPSGYPVIIVQHGLSGSREYLLDQANRWCDAGWAVVAIDSVTFGARAPGPDYQHDLVSNFATKETSAAGQTYAGPDGFADPVNGATNGSSDIFGGLLNIGALRDQLRQAPLDTAQVVKVLRSNPDLSALKTGSETPKFDGSKIGYVGDSLGGIEGALSAAVEPGVSGWVLNVAGAGIVIDLAAYSPVISKQLALAGGFNFGFQADVFTPSHPIITLVQSITDLGDPLTYARALVTSPAKLKGVATKPRNIIQIEVVGDEIVSNEGSEALARAAGFPMATPNVGSNAELSDLAKPDQNPHRIAFAQASPDGAGSIHDAPMMGATAVLVQTAAGTHGFDFVRSRGMRNFKAPFAQFDQQGAFPTADAPYDVSCAYRELQSMSAGFFADAFSGKVPGVKGFKPPVRDLDDDGAPDATDSDPNDPKKK
jgi:dienelactone hydrolase